MIEDDPQARGRAAEHAAVRHLESHGLRLLVRNYRCRLGEIDVIARDGVTTVFVEVRYRRSERYGGALESIDGRKRGRIVRAAQHYLQSRSDRRDPACRFDVVLVSGNMKTPRIDWIANAFQA